MINKDRILKNLADLGKIGAMEGGGVCRPALTSIDKEARDWLLSYMKNLGLSVDIDELGNMFGSRDGVEELDPVVFGSHLDTVFTGGLYDGSLGVLAALEVMESIVEADIQTRRPLVMVNFTNEEGVRFAPDMMGSLGFSKQMSIEEIWNCKAYEENISVKDALKEIGYLGDKPLGYFSPFAFLELHIEQGPILENENIPIGVVDKLQGIFWTRYHFAGKAAHAGTTPLSMRSDSLLVAGKIIQEVRKIAGIYNGVGTVGSIKAFPNAINVVAESCEITVDLRNPNKESLLAMQKELDASIIEISENEGVVLKKTKMVRFDPVNFNNDIVVNIEKNAAELGLNYRRMISGAGHDAQMMSKICPTAMIFVPSINGISHNINELTPDKDVINGTRLLGSTVLSLSEIN